MKIFYWEALYGYFFSLCGFSSCFSKVPHRCYECVCVCVWQEVRERENLLKPLSNWKSQTTEMPGGRWQPGFRQRVPQAESEHSVQKSVFGDLTTPVRSDLFYESVI